MRLLMVLVLLAGTARAETSDRDLIYAGLALTPPMYLLGVGMHEGSHALAAKLVGGEVMSVRVFPPGIDPRAGRFRFGWTYVRGLRSRNQKQLFYVAPKITNAVLLGGFAALVFTDAWPSNRYGQLALTVFATGMWVDFSKDLVLFHGGNDVVKLFRGWCMTGWRHVPARLVYAGMVVGLGAIVAHGFQRTFDDPELAEIARQLVVPVVTTTF